MKIGDYRLVILVGEYWIRFVKGGVFFSLRDVNLEID